MADLGRSGVPPASDSEGFDPVGAPNPDVAAAVSRALGRGGMYTVATAVQLGAAFLTLPLVTRVVDPGEFGVVITAQAVAALLIPIAGAGLPSALTREYYSEQRRERTTVLVAAAAVSAALIAGFVHLTSGVWIRVFSDLTYSSGVRWTIAAVVANVVIAAVMSYGRAADRVVLYVMVALAGSVGARCVGLALAWVGDSTADAFLTGTAAGSAVAAALGWLAIGVARPTRRDRGLVERGLRVGVPLVPHLVAMWGLVASDRVVIERALGTAEAGRYQLAYTIGSLPLFVLGALNNAWGPAVQGAATDALRWSVLARSRDLVHRLTLPMVALVALGAPIGLRVIAPATYDATELHAAAAVISLAAIPYVPYMVAMHVLLFHRRTSVVAWITPLIAGANIGANLVLVPRFGLVAAAVDTVVAYGALALLVGRRAAPLAPIARPSLRWPRLLAILVAGSILVVALPTDGWGLAVRVACCLVAAAAAALELRSHRASPR